MTNKRPHRPPPQEVLWVISTVSLILPVVGVVLAVTGLVMLMQGNSAGGWWLAGGALMIVVDYLTDIWLYRVSGDGSEEPELNLRTRKHAGRVIVLEHPIQAGYGRACLSGSWWRVEGPDLPAGTRVRIVEVRSSVLVVEPD
ncbi:MAG: NfeD family protein [Hyphomicrobiaceae bacterium]